MNEAELRKRFEHWMVAGSFGWIGRIPEDASTDKAGEYYGPAVQVAWMAWCEAHRQAIEKPLNESILFSSPFGH